MIQLCRQDCPDRSADCHSTCEKWAAWEEHKKKEYARRNDGAVVRGYYYDLDTKLKHKESRRTK